MQVKVIERTQQIQLQEQEITRRERELEATVRKPADAEKYRLEKIAEANRYVTVHQFQSNNWGGWYCFYISSFVSRLNGQQI